MIEVCRRQMNFAEGLIAEEVGELWEDWMRQVDEVLTDKALLCTVYEGLARRWPNSRTRGRKGTPADVVLRLLLLKHLRNWSYAILEREVRANLVYRQFTRVGAAKVPDAKTLGKLGLALGPEIIEQIHQRVVAIAQEKKLVQGRRLRVDTTVVETDIHYPTDSTLLGDGVRVLTRTMKAIARVAAAAGDPLRDRTRAVKYRVLEIARASRSRTEQGKARIKQATGNYCPSPAAWWRKPTLRARGGRRHQARRFPHRASRAGGAPAISGDDDPAGTGKSCGRRASASSKAILTSRARS